MPAALAPGQARVAPGADAGTGGVMLSKVPVQRRSLHALMVFVRQTGVPLTD